MLADCSGMGGGRLWVGRAGCTATGERWPRRRCGEQLLLAVVVARAALSALCGPCDETLAARRTTRLSMPRCPVLSGAPDKHGAADQRQPLKLSGDVRCPPSWNT